MLLARLITGPGRATEPPSDTQKQPGREAGVTISDFSVVVALYAADMGRGTCMREWGATRPMSVTV